MAVSEFAQGFQGSVGILICLVYSLFCWFGGRDENYLGLRARHWGRRIAPIFLASSVMLLSLWSGHFKWWFAFSVPAYLISHTLGYGGSSLWTKIARRSSWSLVRTSASLTFTLWTGTWTLFVVQAMVGLLITLILGIRNPLKAPVEEGIINFASVIFVPFMVL